MGIWKDNPKQNGSTGEGPAASQKTPYPGVTGGSGVSGQMNPRRDRRQDYAPPKGNQRGN